MTLRLVEPDVQDSLHLQQVALLQGRKGRSLGAMTMSDDDTKKKSGQRYKMTGTDDEFTMFGDRCFQRSKNWSPVSRAKV